MACPRPQMDNPFAQAALTAVYNIRHMRKGRRASAPELPPPPPPLTEKEYLSLIKAHEGDFGWDYTPTPFEEKTLAAFFFKFQERVRTGSVGLRTEVKPRPSRIPGHVVVGFIKRGKREGWGEELFPYMDVEYNHFPEELRRVERDISELFGEKIHCTINR